LLDECFLPNATKAGIFAFGKDVERCEEVRISNADSVSLVLDRVKCFGSPYYLFPLCTEKGSNVQGKLNIGSGARPFGKYVKLGGLLICVGKPCLQLGFLDSVRSASESEFLDISFMKSKQLQADE
jgi:hypothetical protein